MFQRSNRVAVAIVLVISSLAFGVDRQVEQPTTLPACFVKGTKGAERLGDPMYVRMMAGEGLLSVAPPALFGRIKAAMNNGERYKALYLSRLLARMTPNNAAVSQNIDAISGSLGFSASVTRAATLSNRVPSEPLPGTAFKIRPSSLADWAAAVSLVADELADTEGRYSLVALKDSLSGIQVRQMQFDDPVRGPRALVWAEPKPLLLDSILSNLFSIHQARAMAEKGTNVMGLLAAAGTAYLGSVGALTSAQISQITEGLTMDAVARTSRLKEGSYVARQYINGRVSETPLKARPSGERAGIDLPVPVLWASGGSLSSALFARLGDNHGQPAKSYVRRFTQNVEAKSGTNVTVPDLLYPRLAMLYATKAVDEAGRNLVTLGDPLVASPVTSLELILTDEDIRALVMDASQQAMILRMRPDSESAARAYIASPATLAFAPLNAISGASGGGELVGFDESGVCYGVSRSEQAWLMPSDRAPQTPTVNRAASTSTAGSTHVGGTPAASGATSSNTGSHGKTGLILAGVAVAGGAGVALAAAGSGHSSGSNSNPIPTPAPTPDPNTLVLAGAATGAGQITFVSSNPPPGGVISGCGSSAANCIQQLLLHFNLRSDVTLGGVTAIVYLFDAHNHCFTGGFTTQIALPAGQTIPSGAGFFQGSGCGPTPINVTNMKIWVSTSLFDLDHAVLTQEFSIHYTFVP